MTVALDASIYVLHINVFIKYYDVADVMLTFDYGPLSNISQWKLKSIYMHIF